MTPLYKTCANTPAVTALIGTPPRLFPGGFAEEGTPYPYATWTGRGGSPENYLDCLPDVDRRAMQIDCWGTTDRSAYETAVAIRDAVEPHAYVVSWRGPERDHETRSYRYSFDVDWHVER